MIKSFLQFVFLLTFTVPIFGQGNYAGNGGSTPWVVLQDQYPTSPFNDTTKVNVWFDGSSYSGYVTSLQFKVQYDGATFDSLYTITSNLSSEYIMSYNEDKTNDQILISIVYTGSSKTTSFPDTSIITLKFDNIPVKLLYSNQQNITPFTFGGYTAVGSNSNSTDISIGTFSHGGVIDIPHRRFTGYVKDYGTGRGISNLEYQLFRGNSLITTTLGGQPTRTSSNGYYELVYYEYFFGAITNETDFDFLFKTEVLDSDNALSTADSYKVLLYANNKITLNAYQRLAADVNHSHTNSIADAYALYSYNSGAYTNWRSFGAGGYRDVMIIKPEDLRFLGIDSTTVTPIGVGPLGFSPQETNWTYDLNAYNGITDLREDFYVVIMGDVNLTSLGGSTPPSNKIIPFINYLENVNTSIIAQLPDKTVVTGDEFLVQLTLDTFKQDVHSFDFELDYDPELLEFLEASTSYLPNAWQLYFKSDSLGTIKYGGLDASVGDFPIRTDSSESILEFKFKAKQVTGVGETPIKFGDKYNTGDRNGDDLTTTIINGKVYLQIITSGIEPTDFPRGFQLEQNYPNPFNPSTVIGFTVVNPQTVSINLYSIDGRFLWNIYNDRVGTGRHEVTLNTENLSSGVYVYTLSTQNGTQTRKLTLIK